LALLAGLLLAVLTVAGASNGMGLIIGEQARATVAAFTVAAAFTWVGLGLLIWALLIVVAHMADCLTDIRDGARRRN
jgi:hypothetical protein